MDELDMCKAMAKLDGIEMFGLDSLDKVFIKSNADVGPDYYNYNPITDISLTFKAMVDYKVNIDHHNGSASIDGGRSHESPKSIVFFYGTKTICMAIIECILKANGLYHE